MKNNKYHEPVMAQEALYYLGLENAPLKNQARRVIDTTVGTGGYTLELCQMGVEVLGLDADENMLKIAKERLETACPASDSDVGGSYKLIHGNFKDLETIATKNAFDGADGVVYDLGVSSLQLTSQERGFSFSESDAPLDMRIGDNVQKTKAADLLNALRKDQLVELFSSTLNKPKARKVAQEVINRRKEDPFETVGDLLEVIEKIFEKRGKVHPATKPFLALRMATNSELENLEESLPQALKLLKKGGRLVVVSFHSGEDAIVKDFFKKAESDSLAKILTRSPINPSEVEVRRNPRSRSAKLRAIEKN